VTRAGEGPAISLGRLALIRTDQVFVGIDVGGPKKGYHMVSLVGHEWRDIDRFTNVEDVVERCVSMSAAVVAIDAPCRWSASGRARRAERELMAEGIGCFSTPSQKVAEEHPKNHFGWMRAGIALYAALERSHPLLAGAPVLSVAAETFPHAVACALAGKIVSAKNKSSVRRRLLRDLGFDDRPLGNIDYVDAALCAVAARSLLEGYRTYGDIESGLIVVPRAEDKA
jgi:predicted nuclease with RNAse H fold